MHIQYGVLFTLVVGIISFLFGCQPSVSSPQEPMQQTKNGSSPRLPNFVWLVSEDNSKDFLKLYNNAGVSTPNIEALAEQGLVFDNALSNAPVCSTARTALALGVYPNRLAMNYHRANRKFWLPESISTVSTYLRQIGYYTSNNAKKDYNFIEPRVHWHASKYGADWQKREDGQPFFHMQSWGTTHEHNLQFPVSDLDNKLIEFDLEDVSIPPIYPDTELFRYSQARYLELHKKLDIEIGDVVKKLKQEGVLEDTFIFYFGDHGGALPGSKAFVYERGLNVPLVVRIPKNFRHLVHKDMQGNSTTRVTGFVSFIDFLPTLLTLAGIDVPESHDGETFLGEDLSLDELNQRDEHFAFADRFDEKYDMVRTYRKGKFKYIRHYLPFNPDGLFADYRYKNEALKQWKGLFVENKLNSIQDQFFKMKAPEALYDLINDPYETKNLAKDPAHQNTLLSLRSGLQSKLTDLPDLGFFPEYHLIKWIGKDPVEFAENAKGEIKELQEIADLALIEFKDAEPQLRRALTSDNEWHRYWGMNVVLAFGKQSLPLAQLTSGLVNDVNHLVQARVIQFRALFQSLDPKESLEALIKNTHNSALVLAILNIATQLHDQTGVRIDIPMRLEWQKPDKSEQHTTKGERQRAINYWFMSRLEYLKS